jgi:hypothetical protein
MAQFGAPMSHRSAWYVADRRIRRSTGTSSAV